MKVNHEVFCTNLESFLPNQCRKSNPTKNTWKSRSVAATTPCGRKPKPGTACNSKSDELPILPSHFCVTDTKGRVSLPLKILKAALYYVGAIIVPLKFRPFWTKHILCLYLMETADLRLLSEKLNQNLCSYATSGH